MADKTALNTSYTYYANIVMASGFVAASGDFEELVTGTNIGVVSGTTTSRGTDGTHGTYISLESDNAVVNFGDNVNWDGMANCTVALLLRNDATSIPGGSGDSQAIVSKIGSGADAFEILWQNSENVFCLVGGVSASITDGLDNGAVGAVATNWNVVGFTVANGGNLVCRVNELKATTGSAVSVPATAHSLRVGNYDSGTLGWLGDIAGIVILDVELSDAEWADLVADFTGELFAAEGGGEITGTGALSAQSSAVAGTAERTVTGSGTPAAQASTVAGTAEREITGSGALSADSSEASGTAERNITGTGALVSQDAEVSGTGAVGNEVSGSGALQAQSSSVSGAAERAITATGSLQAQPATVSGVGIRGAIGTGALAANDSSLVGVAQRVITGSGSLSAQTSTVLGYQTYQIGSTVFVVEAENRTFRVAPENRIFAVVDE